MHAAPKFDFPLGEAAETFRENPACFADEQIMPRADRTDR